MTRLNIDLLPTRTRSRIRAMRRRGASLRVGLALIAIATVAAVAAEQVRIEAHEREDAARAQVEMAFASRGSIAMAERAVVGLADAVRSARLADARMGCAALVAAIADRLPADAVLGRIVLRESDCGDLLCAIEGLGDDADGALFAARIASIPGMVGVRFEEPSEGAFVVRGRLATDPVRAAIALGEDDDVD